MSLKNTLIPLTLLAACALESEPAPEIHEVASELGAAGVERMIPIRFSQLLECDPAITASCGPLTSYEMIRRSVDRVNEIYRPAGVQFYLEANDLLYLPRLSAGIAIEDPDEAYDLRTYRFDFVKQELQRLIPNMPLDAWADSTKKNIRHWIHAANTIYEDNRHVHVWIEGRTGKSSGAFPYSGRGIRMRNTHLGGTVFAHEMGHFLGLSHTHAEDNGVDAETLAPLRHADRWDLVYLPGTSPRNRHAFFNSRSEAAQYPDDQLQLIDRDSCSTDTDGTVTCMIGLAGGYGETHTTGSPALKGLAFERPDGVRGANVMSYDDGKLAISESQIQNIRKYLRWEVPIGPDALAWMMPGYNVAKYGTPTLSSRRPRLGSYGANQPAERVDFDGDGLRDLAFYIPAPQPTLGSRFVVRLSSRGYSSEASESLDLMFGELGDEPVLGDYNGDGRTDIAVFQPGGGIDRDDPTDPTAYWRYCPTAANPLTTTCTSVPAPIAAGRRGDTPLPGHNFDGARGDELAYYRTTTGVAYLRNVSGSWTRTRAIGLAGTGVVPMAALYDCDGVADLAVYEPTTARVKLLLSTDDWSATITHQLDTKLIPHPTGDATARAGAIVLGDLKTRRLCLVNGRLATPERAAAAVYSPDDGTWNIVWNPASTGTVVTSCTHGTQGDRDQPIGGLDVDGDGQSDLALFRPSRAYGGPGILSVKSSAGACDGTSSSISSATHTPRVRMFPVADMTGDGKGEVVVLDEDGLELRWLTSESGYYSAIATPLPAHTAIPL